MVRAKLLEAYVEVSAVLKASENWEPSYKASPATFKRLVREEAELQASVGEYLIGLAQRAERLVNWPGVKLQPIQAAVTPPKDDEAWTTEEALLYAAAYRHILELTAIGGQAGEDIYSRPIGLNTLTDYILDSAGKHTAHLVSQVTDTTRQYIRDSIKQAIREGRDFNGTLELVRARISNPVRAEMIASTESVNAYQNGLYRFGKATGAVSKTWDALSGACKLCAPLDGKTIKVDKLFKLHNGNQVEHPSAHVRCRCGLIYNYEQ